MLSFFIVLFLLGAFVRGWRMGFTKQFITTIGSILVFSVAWRYNATLSDSISHVITTFDQNYAVNHINNIISFYLIITVGGFLIFWLGRASKAITWLPVIKQTNALAGGLLSLLVAYIAAFILLWTFSLLPIAGLNHWVDQSNLAQWITQQTPLLTKNLINSLFRLS